MKKNQNIQLYCTILGLCIVLFGLCAFMMPKTPTYTEKPNEEDAQTRPTTDYCVVLDPGHGGYDEGASSADGRIVESEFDLLMAKKVQVLLQKQGVEVIMTRTSDDVSWPADNVEDLQARLEIANKAKADLMVSIHCNSSHEDPLNVSGSEVYANSKQSDSVSLAESIVASFDGLEPNLRSRGVKHAALHLLTYNKIPTVIVEMAFVTNPKDVDYLLNETTQNLMCEKIAEGIMNELKK